MGNESMSPVVLEYSEKLGRVIRKDPGSKLGESSWIKLKDAIESGDSKFALRLLDYLMIEGKGLHDGFCDWTYADLDYVAKKYGEEEIPLMLRYAFGVLGKSVYKASATTTLEDIILRSAELNRSHRAGPKETGHLDISEDEDRYVMSLNPCGSGGRMRRGGGPDGNPSRTEPPFNLGKTSKPYPWSWSKAGVPYYCVHCCVWNEQLSIEAVGYPIRVTDYCKDPDKPCGFIFYKDPHKIPEHYFTRVGKKKDPSKFVKL